MKNSIFQVIIIAILLLGMTASVLVINENTGNANQNVYYPEINDSSADSTEILDLNGYKRISFENKTYKSIAAWDYFLTLRYGNYMELPPDNQRRPYHGGKYYWK
jgi:phosphorylcholine metabolism protein LicD